MKIKLSAVLFGIGIGIGFVPIVLASLKIKKNSDK